VLLPMLPPVVLPPRPPPMPVLAPLVVLPPVPPDALEPLLTPPHWRTQLSRSMPVRPTHWLGSGALPAALVSELVLAPPVVLEPVLVLGAVLPEVPPAAPALVPAEPLALVPAEPPAAP